MDFKMDFICCPSPGKRSVRDKQITLGHSWGAGIEKDNYT